MLFTDPWLPVIRSPGQRYIFWELESPAYLLGFPPQAYANYFNWTATFRLDSTVPLPYGQVTKVDVTLELQRKVLEYFKITGLLLVESA